MAISGGSVDELIENDRRAKRSILIRYGFSNLLALWICGPITLGSLEIVPIFGIGIWLAGVIIVVILMLVVTILLLGRGSKTAEKAYFAPLGLVVTQIPELKPDLIGLIGSGQLLIPDGPAIVEGERYGRLVHIETLDKHSLTVLQATLPEFKVRSEEGKLIPEKGAPVQVGEALKSLRKAKRWQGINIFAGPQGLGIQRQSKGTNMWLFDI